MAFNRLKNPPEAQRIIRQLHQQVVRDRQSMLFSFNRPLPIDDSQIWTPRLKDIPRMSWFDGQQQIGFMGFGVAAALKASGPERFHRIELAAKRLFLGLKVLGNDQTGVLRPRLFGGFSFLPEPDPRSIWASFASAYFILPRYLLTRFKNQSWLTFSHQLRPEDDPDDIAWLLSDDQLLSSSSAVDQVARVQCTGGRADQNIELLTKREDWRKSVYDATDRINQGRLQKVVLARVLRIVEAEDFDPVFILERLGEGYPDCYRFLFEPLSGQAFFGATPELLLRVEGHSIQTDALAGSIARGRTDAEDEALARRLLNSPKERLEHELVVREIKSRLSPLTNHLVVPSEPQVRKLENIQHLETPIWGTLLKPVGALRLAETLHATPAVGGLPRDEALRLINKYESFSRGWYAAPIGWIDANLDGMFAVAIRSALHSGKELRLFAGAGIVANSDPDQEWEETSLKFRPVLNALNGG